MIKLLRALKRKIMLALFAGLAGCANVPSPPQVVTQRVEVPIATPCLTAPVQCDPAPDTAAALKADPTLLGKLKLLLEGRDVRSACILKLQAAQAACLTVTK